jgi:sugar lactone lactonase YvrE
MIKKLLLGFVLIVGLLIAYLSLWPVPIEPEAWDAPMSEGYVGQFASNTELANLDTLSIGDHHGPEDIAARIEDGKMIAYTSTQTGDIIRVDTVENTHSIVANTGGVALGLQFDANGNLIVADAHKGLLSLNENWEMTVLTDRAENDSPILYADELDIAEDGKIYFSDASTKFGAEASGAILSGSLLEIMEHANTGRVLVYDPADGRTRTVADNFSFANGIAMCPDDECLLVAETGSYRILKIWLTGEKAGEREVIIDNLPGFPDNINRGLNGRYWVGLTSPRADILDELSGKPGTRKMIQRLPAFMRPSAELYGFILAIDVNGNVLAQYQDPSAGYPMATGATEPGDGWLYIGSLEANVLGRKNISGEEF